MPITSLDLAAIRTDGGTQVREALTIEGTDEEAPTPEASARG